MSSFRGSFKRISLFSQQVGEEEEQLPEKREDPDGGEELGTHTNPPSPTEVPITDANGTCKQCMTNQN